MTEKCRGTLPRLASKSIRTHYLGIDTDKYHPSDTRLKKGLQSQFTVVLNGRFVPKKGHFTALKAFRIVLDKIPDALLLFVGDGLLRDQIQKEISRLDLHNNVIIKGKLRRDRVIDLYRTVDVGIQPSEKHNGEEEGLPTSTMEYSAMKLPVVATYHAGIPEIVKHEETGFLINEGNFDMLAKYLIILAEDRKLANKLGNSGRKFILHNFSLKKQNIKLIDLYEQFTKN